MPVAPLSSLDSFRDRVVYIQRELTRRPALGPENNGTGETEKAAWLLDFMKGIGLSEIREHPCPDDRVPDGFRPKQMGQPRINRAAPLYCMSGVCRSCVIREPVRPSRPRHRR